MTARCMVWGQIEMGRLAEIASLGEKIMERVECSDVAVYHSELCRGGLKCVLCLAFSEYFIHSFGKVLS